MKKTDPPPKKRRKIEEEKSVHSEAIDILTEDSPFFLGKHAKQIFGKSWDFGPRRGGGV